LYRSKKTGKCLLSLTAPALMKYLPVLIITLLLCSTAAHNGYGQLSSFYDNRPYTLPAGALQFHVDSSHRQDWDYYKQIEPQLLAYPQNDFNNSYRNRLVWMKIDLGRLQQPQQLRYLLLRNPHINYLNVWLLKNGVPIKAFEPTGDRREFSTRPIYFSDFIFPLPPDSLSQYQVVLMADKRNEVSRLPLYFLTEAGLIQYTQEKNWLAGLFIGIGLFLFLFNLYLFLSMREWLYIFYGLYIVLSFLYIFSDMGFTFMYLLPNQPLLSDFTRPISITLATPVYIFFGMELLQVKNNLPAYYRWMLRALMVYVILLVSSLMLASDTGPIRVVLSGLSYLVLSALMLFNITIAWKSMKKKVSYSWYFIVSSSLLCIMLSIFTIYLSGHLADTTITRNMMRIAIVSEISILTLALAHRFKKYKISSEQLLRKVNEQQEHIFASVTDYQENEMQRLSSLLHDSVGARLSSLRFNLESDKNGMQDPKLKLVINEITQLANEVRQFSHDFSPILLQKNGLRATITKLIRPVNETGKLFIQFEMMGSRERTSFRYEMLVYNIIQELVQNIIKHSRATEAIIQLILEEEIISIFVEDNGKGFDPDTKKDGLGFSQIKQLVTFVNGTLRLETAVNRGLKISIEFSIIQDEGKHPLTYS